MMPRLRLLLLLLSLPGCGRQPAEGPIGVSVIGGPLPRTAVDPSSGALDASAAQLLSATGQGLLRFDAGGQVVAGTAARWAVADGGRSLLFRLPDVPPPGTKPADAGAIARWLRAQIAPASRNPLKPLLGAIHAIDAVTPQVVDIELSAPRPNMLQLFAQPALALGPAGRGPFVPARQADGAMLLRPLATVDSSTDATAVRPTPAVLLRGEAASRAVARFAAGRSSLVLGGGFTDLPVARAASPAAGLLRFDPAKGLFGLMFLARNGEAGSPTADPAIRAALSMAIDRDRIGRWLSATGWSLAEAIVPPGTPEIADPAQPDWRDRNRAERRTLAAATVADWRRRHGPVAPLRIAMPPGPGARVIFAYVARDWRAIGIPAVAVPDGADADLRLLDVVAPTDSASFYLRHFACAEGVVCTALTDRLLDAARRAPTMDERRVLLTQADALLAREVPFIAFGSPIRWSLVDTDLDLYRDSPWALHPLNELRTPLKR